MKKPHNVFLISVFSVISCAFLPYSDAANPDPSLAAWRDVQKKCQNAVTQVFVHTAIFNWKEPYKAPEQDVSYGSGFFIDKQGHLVTNFHVVDQGCDIKVQIPSLGKEQFDMEMVGACPDRDLALLRLTPKSRKKIEQKLDAIPFLSLGDSDKIVRTQAIMALGYPLGQEKLKSIQGIVSGRENVWGESYIQVSAAFNPGNSGGPSLSMQGDVIGINTARMPSAQNISYIIPINDMKSVIKDLHHVRLLRKPALGCDVHYSTQSMVQYFSNPAPGGLYISRVYPDTPFYNMGVKAGDMLYGINDHSIDLYGEALVDWSEDKVPLDSFLNRFWLGKEMKAELHRKGQKIIAKGKLEQSKPLAIRKMYPDFEKIDYEICGGMTIMQLSLNLIDLFVEENPYLEKYTRRRMQYKPRLIITNVFPNSQAQKARIVLPGDIITHVNDKPVYTLDQLRDIAKDSDRFVTFKTQDKKLIVFDIQALLKDEEQLTKKHLYKRTPLVQELEKRAAVQGDELDV